MNSNKLVKVIKNGIIICAAIVTIINYSWGWIKIVLSFLTIKIDSFWLIMAFFVVLFLLVNINRISPEGRKYKKTKSYLEEKTKQYDGLVGKYDELVKKVESGLEEKIQLRQLEKKAQHIRREEPKIKIKQKFVNASDYDVKITQIEAIFRTDKGDVIDQFLYEASDHIFKDEHKLFFPKDIAPLSFDNEVEYWIKGAEKLAIVDRGYKRHDFLMKVEQAIEFAARGKTIIKKDDKALTIQPEDWNDGAWHTV